MRTINREELKALLDKGENVQLVMTYSKPAFEQVHIPGSVHFQNMYDAGRLLSPDKETIVYCTNPSCYASVQAYYHLRNQGFQHITRYSGGLEDWSDAGYRLEGNRVA